jgi:hypothetical protein
MSEYIITVVPVADDGSAAAVAQTMVRVETDGYDTTVKELVVRAPDGAGLASGDLPRIDFELLLRALQPSGVPRSRRPAPAPEPASPPAPRRGGVARISRAAEHLQAGRAYRRAPDLDELEEVYLRVGTIAGVAAHFEVPVHTAQGWITRMRRRNNSPAAES